MSALAPTAATQRMSWELLVVGLLIVGVFVAFGESLHCDFVNFDDPDYVVENRDIQRGIGADSLGWAATATRCNNWHPLTWVSHMLDYQMFGPRPGGHHLTSLLLHAANAVLLFLALRRLTGDLWPSAFVAAVFAVHPLRAESVVWVAERKDVLSGLLFMLTLLAYAAYVRRPFSWQRYLLVAAAYTAGIMAKPMLVTVPMVLLLLDYWPLGRLASEPTAGKRLPSPLPLGERPGVRATAAAGSPIARDDSRRVRTGMRRPMGLVVEKIPLFALAAVSCAATVLAQSEIPTDVLGFSRRLAGALVAYVVYIGRLFYPADLTVLYPYPASLPSWEVCGSALLLAVITAAAVVRRRKDPYLLVGWLWYLGMLVPVIGLVQVGRQATADRYTYLPHIGLCVAIAWTVDRIARRWPGRVWIAGPAAAAIAVLTFCARQQTEYWHNSETLWKHATECTEDNVPAHANLAAAYAAQGHLDRAAAEYRAALAIRPRDLDANNNLGNVLARQGHPDEAFRYFHAALAIDPHCAAAHCNLADLLMRRAQPDEASDHYRQAAELLPNVVSVRCRWADALARQGRLDDAMEQLQQASKLGSGDPLVFDGIATLHAAGNRFSDAIAAARQALDCAVRQKNDKLAASLRRKIAIYESKMRQ
jgi:protein O-mannosyl-transferase